MFIRNTRVLTRQIHALATLSFFVRITVRECSDTRNVRSAIKDTSNLDRHHIIARSRASINVTRILMLSIRRFRAWRFLVNVNGVANHMNVATCVIVRRLFRDITHRIRDHRHIIIKDGGHGNL